VNEAVRKVELLVIDDEKEMLVSYERILSRGGYGVDTGLSAEYALTRLGNGNDYSLVISDLNMPGMDGMTFLSPVRERHPHVPVIIVTGYGTLDTAIEAVKIGAFDYIEKPFSTKKLLDSVSEALLQIIPDLDDESTENGLDNMIGRHPSMKKIFELVTRVAAGNANVLITGESGVGKELVARSIHNHSLRRNRPLIPINCSALPDTLFESELFGYEKGAFTGAFQSKPGLVELANGGTLFLDEVCEMSQSLQAKLLRMLEDRRIRRIGGEKEIRVDLRIVTATNKDVDKMVSSGALREDFFYRINTFNIDVPPLRQRLDDIPLLALHFLQQFEEKYGRGIDAFEAEAVRTLRRYSWPGNVRELQNIIERTYYLADPPVIRRTDFPTYLTVQANHVHRDAWQSLSYKEAKDQALEAFEKEYLGFQLDQNNWNISRTAEQCGMDRRTVHRLIKRFGLKRS